MMVSIQGAGGRSRGFVRAVQSRRGGYAVAAESLRGLLGVLRRSAAMDRKKLRLIASRARVAGAFADYLVTDSEPAFVPGRGAALDRVVGCCLISGPGGLLIDSGVLRAGFACESLDAPDFMAAGSLVWSELASGKYGWVAQGLVMRGAGL
jgi:hypothetical protein